MMQEFENGWQEAAEIERSELARLERIWTYIVQREMGSSYGGGICAWERVRWEMGLTDQGWSPL